MNQYYPSFDNITDDMLASAPPAPADPPAVMPNSSDLGSNAKEDLQQPQATAASATTTSPSSTKTKKNKRETGIGLRKAPGAPKRFKSSYILFFMAKQKEIKDELGEGASVSEISKRSSQKWKLLSAEERAIWDEKAEKDKERYNQEKERYTGPWQVPWKRAKKNPNAPKRPMSAFLFFSQTKRKSIKDEYPGIRNTEVSRILGDMWKKASPEEQAPHIEREAAERQKYKVAIAKWREGEARRKKEEENEKKMKDMETTLMEKQSSSPKNPPDYRDSPLSFHGTSPLPIHHSRSSSPGGPMPNYYHGPYGYPVPNYGGPPPPPPPPPPQYNPYGSYPQQPSPQNAYYQNYPPMPPHPHPAEYQPRSPYHDFPPPPQSGSREEAGRHNHPVPHAGHAPPPHYGSYFPPDPSYSAEPLSRPLTASSSNENDYNSCYPPPS